MTGHMVTRTATHGVPPKVSPKVSVTGDPHVRTQRRQVEQRGDDQAWRSDSWGICLSILGVCLSLGVLILGGIFLTHLSPG